MKVFFVIFFCFLLLSCASIPQNKARTNDSQYKDDLSLKIDLVEQRLELEKEIREARENRLREWVKDYVNSYVKNLLESQNKKEEGLKPALERKTNGKQIHVSSEAKIKKVVIKKNKKSDPNFMYHHALNLLLKRKDIKGAKKLFEDFIKRYPKHKLIPNAYYWLGECYYTTKNYPKAIITFKTIPNKYPKSLKASDALLKIGYSYWNLKQFENAKFYLNRLISLYPNSSASIQARRFLEKVGNASKG